jgi:hypothetical protein
MMLRLAFMAMGGLALILGCIVAGEAWSAHGGGDTPVVSGRSPALRLATVAPASPARTGVWAAAVLARPLFTPSRRPPAVAATAGPLGQTLPRLTGIMVSPEGRLAIFAPVSGKPIVVQPGQRLGRFTVRNIARDQVTVLGPAGMEIIHIAYDQSPAGSAVTSAAVAVHGSALPSAMVPPPGSLFAMPHITKTLGGITLSMSPGDLPSAATWSGPPPLSQLVPPSRPPPASRPLLSPASRPLLLPAKPTNHAGTPAE